MTNTTIKSTAADLTAKLNRAAERAGETGGYTVTTHTDNADSYADYCGFAVAGPNVERALAWLEATLRKECPDAHVRRHAGRDFRFVATARYSLGD